MIARPEDEPGQERRFGPTSGVFSGWMGVGLAALVIVSVLADDHSLRGVRFILVSAIFALLLWCFMLRPRLVIGPTEIELRNPVVSWHVPLVGVRRAEVRAVTMVYTDDRRFDGVAVGRPVRTLVRGKTVPQRSLGIPGLGANRISEGAAASRQPKGQLDTNMVADLVVEQILFAADRARETGQEPTAPRRTWAWPEVGLLIVLVGALVVTLV